MKKKQHVRMNSSATSKNPENEETKGTIGDDIGRITSNRETHATLPIEDEKKIGKKRKRPSEFIQRTPNDVLCGRGIPIQNYHGNIRLHRIIDSFRDEYLATSRRDKPDLIRRIVAKVKEGGARFLKRKSAAENSRLDHWEEMDDSYAYEKVSHALRCRRYVDNSGNDSEAPLSSDAGQPVVPRDIPVSTHLLGNSNPMMWFLQGRGPLYSTSSNLLSAVDRAHNPIDNASIREAADYQSQRRRLLDFENQRAAAGTTFPRAPAPGIMPMFGAPFSQSPSGVPHSASNLNSITGLAEMPRMSSLYSSIPLNLRTPPNVFSEPQTFRIAPTTGAAMNEDPRDVGHHEDLALNKSLKALGSHDTTRGIESLGKTSLDQPRASEKGELEGHHLGAASAHSLSHSRGLGPVGDHSSLQRRIDGPILQFQLESRVPHAVASIGTAAGRHSRGPSGALSSNTLQPRLHIPSSIAPSRVATALTSSFVSTATRYDPTQYRSMEAGSGLTVMNDQNRHHHHASMMYQYPSPLSQLLLGSRSSLWTIPPEMTAGRPPTTQQNHHGVAGRLPTMPSRHDGDRSTNEETMPTTSRSGDRAESSLPDSETLNKESRPSGHSKRNDDDQQEEDDSIIVSRKKKGKRK